MRSAVVMTAVALAASTLVAGAAAADHAPANAIHETLTGYQEDPAAVSTAGGGQFHAKISDSGGEIAYELSYANTTGAVTQAHIHFGGRAQSGGISVFLCSNLGNGPAGTQPCPPGPATITGTITAPNVIGPNAQGIAPGEFDELLAAVRAGATYVNVHTTAFPGGEIRAQLGHDH